MLRLAQTASLQRLADAWITAFNTGADRAAKSWDKILSLAGVAAGADSVDDCAKSVQREAASVSKSVMSAEAQDLIEQFLAR